MDLVTGNSNSQIQNQTQTNNPIQIMSAIKGSSNPMMALFNIIGNDPRYSEATEALKATNNNPKAACEYLAKKKGINPNNILAQISHRTY